MAQLSLLDLLSRILIGLGVLLLAAFTYCFAGEEPPGQRLAIPEKAPALDGLPPGQPVDVTFVLRNTGRLPLRVVGLAEC